MPRASVTTIIQNLEAFLNVRLLHARHAPEPHADGAAYYERCVRILADIEETESRSPIPAKVRAVNADRYAGVDRAHDRHAPAL